MTSEPILSRKITHPETCASTLIEQVRSWNATSTSYPRDATVAQLFERTAAAHADSIALVCGKERLTYGELNTRANQLAHRLRELGVGSEAMVGCCMERSIELIIAMVAVLKAGGAYVPLDPAYPKERFNLLLEDTRTQVMLTQQSIASTLFVDYANTCLVVDALPRLSGPVEQNPVPIGGPKSLAYVMYTSGSTGRPKGVMVEQRAIIRLVQNTNFCRFGTDEVFLQYAPISFDASTLEIWGPLLNGGRLVIMPPQTTSLEDLGRVIREHNVTVLWLTAGLFNLMVEERLEDLRSVRQLLAGGDVLSPRHVRSALNNLQDCNLINGYGPTENTTFTCCHTMRAGEPVPDSIPIGRPISNTQVYILDEQLCPVPPGTTGELYAAGDGLARGYLNDPQTTEQRFLPNPFVEERGSRMYRTGDLARWRADGVIEFLGRADSQVKILGHRIEPGEIESVLGTHEHIKQNCVVPRTEEDGSKRLIAYYVCSVPHVTAADLRTFLAKKIPGYMIPAIFVPVASLPLTPNGKIDRAALPEPNTAVRADASTKLDATQLEQTIIDIWQTYLRVEQLGLTDNFFDLGGDSLSLMRIHTRLQKTLEVQIPITALFEYATVRSLVQYLSGQASSEASIFDARQRAQKQRAAFARQHGRKIGSAL